MQSHRISPVLELRLLQVPDAAELFALVDANRAYLREWLPWIDAMVGLPEARSFIGRMLRDYAATQAFNCGIYSSGRLVGAIGHNHIDWSQRIANPGWWLVPAAQGQGIMTQCCQVVFRHAFEQLRVDRIMVGVAVHNQRGHAVVQRLGFTPVKLLRQAEWLAGRRVDHQIYRLDPPKPSLPVVSVAAPRAPRL
jgi:ribosomal-protein-serine acetyltransferase